MFENASLRPRNALARSATSSFCVCNIMGLYHCDGHCKCTQCASTNGFGIIRPCCLSMLSNFGMGHKRNRFQATHKRFKTGTRNMTTNGHRPLGGIIVRTCFLCGPGASDHSPTTNCFQDTKHMYHLQGCCNRR